MSKMSLGNSFRRIASDFSVGLRIYHLTRCVKPALGIILDTSKCKDVQFLTERLNSLSFTKNQNEKLGFHFPDFNKALNKNITEPDNIIKVSFELPVRKPKDTSLDFPSLTEKEINEPGKVINISAASHMIRIRKRKMKKHKRKKYKKRHWAELKKLKIRRTQEKEALFEKSMKGVLQEMESFSAEKYVDKMLEEAHWEEPITKVRGFLAPKWVIDQHLKEEEYKKIIEERIKECLK